MKSLYLADVLWVVKFQETGSKLTKHEFWNPVRWIHLLATCFSFSFLLCHPSTFVFLSVTSLPSPFISVLAFLFSQLDLLLAESRLGSHSISSGFSWRDINYEKEELHFENEFRIIKGDSKASAIEEIWTRLNSSFVWRRVHFSLCKFCMILSSYCLWLLTVELITK